MGGKATASAPRRRSSSSSQVATSRSVRPISPSSARRRTASSASWAAARMAATSSGSLTARTASTMPPAGTSSTLSGSASRSAGVAAHGQVVVLEAEPQRAVGPALPQRGEQLALAALDVEVRHLALRALDVAEVRDEAAQRRPDDGHAVAAAEAGEVAEVGRGEDEQGVELELGQAGGDAVGAAHNASFRRSSAVR